MTTRPNGSTQPAPNAAAPPMLTEVTLERFKAAFRPGPVALGAFNVIVGRNGSGKSTLLEALQWLDVTMRRDAREASDRYAGVGDLINLRSDTPHFRVGLKWAAADAPTAWRYGVKVESDSGVPRIVEEDLAVLSAGGRRGARIIETRDGGRWVQPAGEPASPGEFEFRETDRLALARAVDVGGMVRSPKELGDFWRRAVFLRLSPSRLAFGSPATRRSFDPILDEEGQTLPALLSELNSEQRARLVEHVQDVLPRVGGVDVSKAEIGRDTRVNYSLLERMPYKGRAGRKEFPIPSWMLSEGTRRITAILALLVREPAPSLLCIEEVENGLDPKTVQAILARLQSASDAGTQVVLTTHSPWLLDAVPIDTIIEVRRTDNGDTKYLRFQDRPEIAAYHPSIPAGTRYVQEAQ